MSAPPSRTKDALIGVVYILVILALIALSIAIYNKDFSTFTTVSVRTDMVGTALQDGSDVKVRGVLIGEVRSISTSGSGVTVHLDLDPGKAKTLPANVTAEVLPKTLFGERYIDLEIPARPSSTHLHSGQTIPQDTSKQSIEVQHLFDDLLPVLQAVQPEKLDATLGELSALLRGRGQTIAQTLTTVGNYLDSLSPQVPKITSDLQQLASVADTYTGAAPDLLTALDAMTTTSRTVVAERVQLNQLYASVSSMADTVGGFVGTNSGQIIGLSRDSLPTLQILAKYSTEFPCIGHALAALVPVADKAFGAGTKHVGAHVILHVTTPSAPYRPGVDTPRFDSTGGPSCPTMQATKTASVVNSPGESEFINELIGPATGHQPSAMPEWSSLLLGPLLRGATVTVR